MRVWLFLFLTALVSLSPVVDAQADSVPDGQVGSGVVPLPAEPDPRRWRLEMTGGFFREAWDLNASREHLVGASLGAAREFSPAWTMALEAHLLHVGQSARANAVLPAATLVMRWRPYRTESGALFIEGGGGLSYASTEVPESGTRFNFVSQTGVGMTRAVTGRVALVGGLRWLHVSNNSLVNRARNPDIQAVGLYLGWQLR